MYKHRGHLLEPFAFSSEQTAKWQNYGHHETREDKCELSDYSFGTQRATSMLMAKLCVMGRKRTAAMRDMSLILCRL